MSNHKAKSLIEFIVKHLVDDPEHVTVEELGSDRTKIVRIKAGKEDSGKIIGKHGRTASALRTILTASAAREKKRAMLEIIDGNRQEAHGEIADGFSNVRLNAG